MDNKIKETLFSEGSLSGWNVYQNTNQNIIVTTEDKLIIKLKNYEDKKYYFTDLIAPFSIILSIITTLITTEFKETALGISKSIWSSIFIVALILSTVWLIYSIVKYLISRNKSIEKLITEIKTVQ